MAKENIVLVGFMGTGKTVVAKRIAAILNLSWVDTDDLIVAREKRKIADIFGREGEPYFRQVERAVIRELCCRDNLVIATGGGAVLNKDNVADLREKGLIICLTASPEKILERTTVSRERPLLNVADQRKKIEELLRLRRPYYAQADYTIDTSAASIDEVTKKVIGLWQKRR